MKKRTLAIIPFIAFLVACNGQTTNDGRQGGEGGPEEKEPVIETYDASFDLPDGGEDVLDFNKEEIAYNSLFSIIEGMKKFDDITIKDNFLIDVNNFVIADLINLVANDEEDLYINDVLKEKAHLELSGNISFTLYHDEVTIESDTTGDETQTTDKCGIVIELTNVNFTFTTEETYKDVPISVTKLALRILMLYDEEDGNGIYIDLSGINKHVRQIIKFVNLFLENPISDSDISKVEIATKSLAKYFVNLSSLYSLVKDDIPAEVDEQLSNYGIDLEEITKTDFARLLLTIKALAYYFISNNETFVEVITTLAKVVSVDSQIKEYVSDNNREVIISNSYDREKINNGTEEVRNLINDLINSLSEEENEETIEDDSNDSIENAISSNFDINALTIPDNTAVDFGFLYKSGNTHGLDEESFEEFSFKLRFAVLKGISIKIENKLEAFYDAKAESYRPSDKYLDNFSIDFIKQIQEWTK